MKHPFRIRPLGTARIERSAEGVAINHGGQIGLPLEYIAELGGQPALGFQPLVPLALDYREIGAAARYRLSPHAVQRGCGDWLVWEDVAVPAHVRTYGPTATELFASLARTATLNELARQLGENPDEVRHCMELLLCAGLIRSADEPLSPRAMWSAREAWFHAQTALARSDRPLGGSYPYREAMAPPPARRPACDGVRIGLHPADLPTLSLRDALMRRRSARTGNATLDLDRLATLLHHSGRVTACEDGGEYEVRRHPYPTGGGLGELEIWVLAERCAGLESGLYRYDPFETALQLEAGPRAEMARMTAQAAHATGNQSPHDAVLLITARMPRSFWKYEGIGYGLTLRNVGALLQSLQLVATALDLATCPIGLVPGTAFAKLTATDPWDEALVGGIVVNG